MNSTSPRRRPSKAVYRRRRLALLLVVLLVVAGVVLAILRPWESNAGTPAPSASASKPAAAAPSPSDSPSPEASAAAPTTEQSPTGEVLPCAEDQVVVTPATDKQSYAAGETVKMTVTLENVSQLDCAIDAGTAAQVFQVTSGDDVYWGSTDCQKDPSNQVVTLTAGQKVPSAAPLVWDRTRSSATTCESEDRPAAPAGGASYHLAVTIGGVPSATTAQFILQ